METPDRTAAPEDSGPPLDLVSLTTLADPWGAPTQWSLIERAADDQGGATREQAWRELIERYRQPVERSLRRQLSGHPDLEECVEEFFGYLFSQNVLPKVDRSRGRFRQYIQGVIRNFARVCRRGNAVERRTVAGQPEDFSLGGEESGDLEVERAELKDWADAVLEHALEMMRSVKSHDTHLLISAYGLRGAERQPREALAARHGLNEGTLAVRLHRGRNLLGKMIVKELRSTVSEPSQWTEEARLVQEYIFNAYPGLRSD